MKAERITLKGVDFIKFTLDRIEQKGESFFVGKVNACDFFKMYTVEPAEYDLAKLQYESKNISDDQEYLEKIITEKREQAKDKKFQRHADSAKLTSVKNYINNKKYAFFPNSVIVTCETSSKKFSSESFEEYIDTVSSDNEFVQSFFSSKPANNDEVLDELYVPIRDAAILIIDGQHRVKGLQEAQEALKKPYELLLSFIINYDRSVVAEQFYTINFTPKKVNKSVLLHLMGDFETGLKELVFLHEVARVFNEFNESPLFCRLKMLGKTNKNLPQDQQRLQTISQAFFIDSLAPALELEGTSSIRQPIFAYYFLMGMAGRVDIQKFLLKYFGAIKNLRGADWNNPESMVCKSVGFGAVVEVMYFYFVMKSVKNGHQTAWINNISTSDIMHDFDGLEKVDLTKFQKLSSASVLSEIKHEIINNLNFFEASSYQVFLANYRTNYLAPYRKWFAETIPPLLKKEAKTCQASLLDEEA